MREGGGASRVAFRRPAGAAAVVSVAGGASKLVFDEQRIGSMGGATRFETPSAAQVPNRYEIDVGGGASELLVVEVDGRLG